MDALTFYSYDDYTRRISLPLGPAAPRSSDDLALQVHNDSDTYQADDVVVTVGGTDSDQLFVSLDGDTFSQSITVGDIPPGAGSLVFTLRRVTASTADEGPASATLIATPGSWTSVVDNSASTNIALDAEVDLDDTETDDDTTQPPIPEGP